jgi:AbrB family looped-hinge helix DNA binding protein
MNIILIGQKMKDIKAEKGRVGVIKEIDKLGRIVIPKEMRDRYALGEMVEVAMTEEGVLVRNPKYMLVEVLPPKQK